MKNPLLINFPNFSTGLFIASIIFLLVAIITRNNLNVSAVSWSVATILCVLVYPLDKEVEM